MQNSKIHYSFSLVPFNEQLRGLKFQWKSSLQRTSWYCGSHFHRVHLKLDRVTGNQSYQELEKVSSSPVENTDRNNH